MSKRSTKRKIRKYRPITSQAFSVNAVRRRLRSEKYTATEMGAAIYMTAVLEYLTCEVIRLAGDVAKSKNKIRISPKELQTAIKNDDELLTILAANRPPDKIPVVDGNATAQSAEIRLLMSKIQYLENQNRRLTSKHEALITTVIKISQSWVL